MRRHDVFFFLLVLVSMTSGNSAIAASSDTDAAAVAAPAPQMKLPANYPGNFFDGIRFDLNGQPNINKNAANENLWDKVSGTNGGTEEVWTGHGGELVGRRVSVQHSATDGAVSSLINVFPLPNYSNSQKFMLDDPVPDILKAAPECKVSVGQGTYYLSVTNIKNKKIQSQTQCLNTRSDVKDSRGACITVTPSVCSRLLAAGSFANYDDMSSKYKACNAFTTAFETAMQADKTAAGGDTMAAAFNANMQALRDSNAVSSTNKPPAGVPHMGFKPFVPSPDMVDSLHLLSYYADTCKYMDKYNTVVGAPAAAAAAPPSSDAPPASTNPGPPPRHVRKKVVQ